MRKVTSALFASVDGVVEAPNLWQFDHFDAEMPELMMTALAKQDTVVLGRRTYEEWADYWPEHDEDFGAFINPVTKWVASRTLTGPLAWANSRLIEGDAVDFVRELKQTEGGEINVAGSPTLVRQLLLAGVIDTLTLMVHPVVAGSGLRRLFHDDDPITRSRWWTTSSPARATPCSPTACAAEGPAPARPGPAPGPAPPGAPDAGAAATRHTDGCPSARRDATAEGTRPPLVCHARPATGVTRPPGEQALTRH